MRAKVFVSGCGMVDDLVASVVQERQLKLPSTLKKRR